MVVEGTASIVEDAPGPHLRHVYRGVTGTEHPDWADFDAAMVRDGRVALCLTVDRLYPVDD